MNEDVRHFLYILPLILIIAIENLLKKLLKQRQGNACKSLHNEQTHFLIYTTKEYNYLKMKKILTTFQLYPIRIIRRYLFPINFSLIPTKIIIILTFISWKMNISHPWFLISNKINRKSNLAACVLPANAPITIEAIFALNESFVTGRDRVMNVAQDTTGK